MPMAFASTMNIGKGATVHGKKCSSKGKGKKRAGVALASTVVVVQPYMPVKLSSSKETQIKAIAVSLKATNAVLLSSYCADLILPLAATLSIFNATLDSPSVAL